MPPARQGAVHASSGRTKGQSNFRIEEDTKLANAYAHVSTDAAVGTDQDGATFWGKIRDNFIHRGGGPERTSNSLQNRFNKVLQFEVQKYIGFLQGALREFHSGWQMDDYVLAAKKQFQSKMLKVFKHEVVYNILKRKLPKFELVISSVDARVARALFLLNNDAAVGVVRMGDTPGATSAGNVSVTALRDPISLITPRPSIGKRKAKLLEFAKKKQANEIQSVAPPTTQQLMVDAAKNGRNIALNCLADAAERKNNMAHEQHMS
jgi:hypothetical protein